VTDQPPEPSLGFPLPKPRRGSDPAATLGLDELVVWQTQLSTLLASKAANPALPLLSGPAQTRLATAARIRLRTEGPGFLDTPHTIRLTIGGQLAGEHSLTGQALIDALDLVHEPATGRLLDGRVAAEQAGADGVSVVAFYLPQFHPFDENDAAWGEGFTEWANVVAAKPRFAGHAMPLLPADLGFYDARLPDLRRRQGELAAQYGVDAFCYHFYWFSGRRVMSAVLDDILYSGQPALPFCLCWANESWSRRWDGSENDVIIAQDHDPAIDETLFADLLPFFADDRYLRVDGAPVLVIYRLDIMHEPERVFAAWNAAARAHGFPGLFIVAARTFGTTEAPAADATVEFPPHGMDNTDVAEAVAPGVRTFTQAGDGFTGRILDYRSVVVNAVAALPSPQLCLPGIMPRWDNTPRRGDTSHLFHFSTPSAFGLWASLALARAAALPTGRRFLFVNSWNEWGEGAMLEPDRSFGRAYLEALRQARSGYAVSPADEARFRLVSPLPPDGATRYLDSFAQTVSLSQQIITRLYARLPNGFRPGAPDMVAGFKAAEAEGRATLDEVHPALDQGRLILEAAGSASIRGWAMMDGQSPHTADRVAFLILADPKTGIARYHLPVTAWLSRTDVRDVHAAGLADEAAYFGFSLTAGVEAVAAGTYDLQMMQIIGNRLTRLIFGARLVRL
jgi:hypothetical protein